jgi:hypothetical protein
MHPTRKLNIMSCWEIPGPASLGLTAFRIAPQKTHSKLQCVVAWITFTQDILQVQKIFMVQHSSLSLYPLFLKNPLTPFIPTLFDPVPRLNRPRDIVQALHSGLHLQNLMLEVAYRSSLVEF